MAKATEPVAEPVFSREELVGAAVSRFGVNPEVVVAALHMAGVKEATIEDATRHIETFLKKEA